MKKIAPPPALPHQKEGVRFLASRKKAALFDEQGLGKTKQLIDAIAECVRQGDVQGAVVVCPNGLKPTWRDEIAKHAPGSKAVMLGSGRDARRRALGDLRGAFYIVNYEAVPREFIVLSALLKFKRFALVLDESHRIKNPDAAVTQAIHGLRHLAARRYILSGTPVANRPDDLWSQAFFLDDGESLGKTVDEFHSRFGGIPGGYANLDEVAGKMSSLGLRRTKKKNLTLPDKVFLRIPTPFSPKQAALYESTRKSTRAWVKDLTSQQVIQQADGILTKLLRLVQIASNPGLIDPSYDEDPGKFLALDKILSDRMSEKGAKVIVWTSFVPNINALCKRYSKYGVVAIHGEVQAARRETAVRQFRTDPQVRLLVANPAAAREGLTLIESRTAIYLDRSFNLVDYLQSQDRIHRIGQTKECEIILLISPGSIDEYLDFTIEQKTRVAHFVQGDRPGLADEDLAFKKPAVLAALLK